MNALLLLALQQAPAIIATLRDLFRTRHPQDPVPTDEEILAAFNEACTSLIQKSEAWLAAHPKIAPHSD